MFFHSNRRGLGYIIQVQRMAGMKKRYGGEEIMYKKRVLGLVLAGILAASALGGCGKSDQGVSLKQAEDTAADTSGQAEGEGKTVLKWALWDLNSVFYYKTMAEAYEAAHPDIEIELVDLGSAGGTDYMTSLSIELTGKDTEFDMVCIQDVPGYSTLVKKGVLEPLTGYIERDGFDLSGYGGLTDQVTLDGKLYELPFRSDFWVLYYNPDLFEKAGAECPSNDMTWAEYDALARKVTDTTPGKEVYGTHYHTWRSCVECLGLTDGKQTMVDGTYDFLKPYYEMVLKQQEDGVCHNYAELKTTGLHHSSAFAQGNVAMYIMGTWQISGFINKIKSGEFTEIPNWRIAKMPHPEGVEAGSTIATITGIAVPAMSDHKEEAWEFIKFMAGPEGAEIVADSGSIPAVKTEAVIDKLAAMEGFPQDEQSREALHTANTYLEMPVHEKTVQIDTALNEVHDSIMTGAVSVNDGIAQLNEEIPKILAE